MGPAAPVLWLDEDRFHRKSGADDLEIFLPAEDFGHLEPHRRAHLPPDLQSHCQQGEVGNAYPVNGFQNVASFDTRLHGRALRVRKAHDPP